MIGSCKACSAKNEEIVFLRNLVEHLIGKSSENNKTYRSYEITPDGDVIFQKSIEESDEEAAE